MLVFKFNDFIKESSAYDTQQIEGERFIQEIKKVLTPDLLKGIWKNHKDKDFSPMSGHCYAATKI